jgi:hypothetical protein
MSTRPNAWSNSAEHPVDMIGVGHVAGDRQRLAAELPDAVRRRLDASFMAIQQHEPASANAIAMARPMPCALPVTTAVRPVRSNRFVMALAGSQHRPEWLGCK